MKIHDALDFVGRAVSVNGEYLIVSDLHYGYTAGQSGGGGLDEEYAQLSADIETLVIDVLPDTLVFAGDLFHSFGSVPDGARESLTSLAKTVNSLGVDIVAVRGNHDVLSPGIIPHIRPVDEYYIDEFDTCVTHGHKSPETDASTYIVGHLHPMLRIQGRKWSTYLYGDSVYEQSNVVVLPSFSTIVEGTAVRAGHTPSVTMPILADGSPLGEYEPIVWDDDGGTTRQFPALKTIDSHLSL